MASQVVLQHLNSLRAQSQMKSACRALTALPRGMMLTVKEFKCEKSMYPNKDGEVYYCVTPYFTVGGVNLYTYLLGDFSNVDQEIVKKTVDLLNCDIKTGVASKFMFYGRMNGKAVIKQHFNDKEKDDDLLAEVKEWESNCTTKYTPTKRNGSETGTSEEDSPRKKPNNNISGLSLNFR